MKILSILKGVELVIADLEVNLGEQVRSAPTLCARYNGKIIPLHCSRWSTYSYERRKRFRKLILYLIAST